MGEWLPSNSMKNLAAFVPGNVYSKYNVMLPKHENELHTAPQNSYLCSGIFQEKIATNETKLLEHVHFLLWLKTRCRLMLMKSLQIMAFTPFSYPGNN